MGHISHCELLEVPEWQGGHYDFVDPDSPEAYEHAEAITENLNGILNHPPINGHYLEMATHVREYMERLENSKTGEKDDSGRG